MIDVAVRGTKERRASVLKNKIARVAIPDELKTNRFHRAFRNYRRHL